MRISIETGAKAQKAVERLRAERAEVRAREQELRSERLAACEAFAGAMVDYRRGEYDRVHQQLGSDPENDVYRATLGEYYRLRSAAQQALLRIRLICDETAVIRAAEDAFDVTGAIHNANNGDEVRAAGERARTTLAAKVQSIAI